MAPTSCGCGRCRSTSPRTTASARRSSPGSPTSIASSQHLPLSARRARRVRARTSALPTSPRCPSSSATCSRLTAELDAKLRQAVEDFDYQHLRPRADATSATRICRPSISISARTASTATRRATAKRRAYRTVLDTLFHALVRCAAPVLVFTTEEVWGTRYPGRGQRAFARMAGGARQSTPTMANGRSCASFALRSPKRSSRCAATRWSARASRPKCSFPKPTLSARPRRAVHHRASDERRQR